MAETKENLDNLTDEEREALRVMREIVAEKGPDYIYPDEEKQGPTCSYLRYDGEGYPVGPSCIVGHYLVRTGMSMEWLQGHEGSAAAEPLYAWEPRLVQAFTKAQELQDNGAPWGEVLEVFERQLGVRD